MLVPPAAEMTPLDSNVARVWQEPVMSADFVVGHYGIEGHELAGMLVAPRIGDFPGVSKQLLVFRTTAVDTAAGIRPIITQASDKFTELRHYVAEGDLTVVTAQTLGELVMYGLGTHSDEWYTTQMLGMSAAVVPLGSVCVFGRNTELGDNLGGSFSHRDFSRRHFALDNTRPGSTSVTDLGSARGTLATL